MIISQAGGLSNLGICVDEDVDDYQLIKEDYNAFKEYDINTYDNYPKKHKLKTRTGKGVRIWSKICLAWSIISVLMFLLTSTFGGELDTAMYAGMFLGEGSFTFIIGLMLHALANSEKGNPYIYLFKKRIKKLIFIIMCIAIAYVLLLVIVGLMGLTGGFNVVTS